VGRQQSCLPEELIRKSIQGYALTCGHLIALSRRRTLLTKEKVLCCEQTKFVFDAFLCNSAESAPAAAYLVFLFSGIVCRKAAHAMNCEVWNQSPWMSNFLWKIHFSK
jgi:hypothetical protein